MTTQVVPTGAQPNISQTTTLDGTPYLFTFTYNQRCNTWWMNIATQEGDDIADGILLVCNWDLLSKVSGPLRPPGFLTVLTNTTDDSPPGLLDLAPQGSVPGATGRCVLCYTPQADIAAALAGA